MVSIRFRSELVQYDLFYRANGRYRPPLSCYEEAD